MTARRPHILKPGALLTAAGLLLFSAVTFAAQDPPKRTTRDGVYTKTQAEAGKAAFDKFCLNCHGFAPSQKSNLSPDLGGDAFLAKWSGKSVRDLATLILTTMPNDGSAVLTEEQTASVVAYVLQQNKFPVGGQPLKYDPAMASITIVK
jgi:mono/diheme cytochrome c family protein